MQNTTHYNLKKPDYTDFADIQDINDNMDTIDEELAAPTGDARDQTVSFTDADLDSGITSFPTFLTKIVSGMKLAKFLRDFKAGMAYVLHVGDLINNATCTESGKALDARMGKTLQDQITSLNDSLAKIELYYNSATPLSTSNILNTGGRALEGFSGTFYAALIQSSTYTHVIFGTRVGTELRFSGVTIASQPTAYAIIVSYDPSTYRVTNIQYFNKPSSVTGIIGIMCYQILKT